MPQVLARSHRPLSGATVSRLADRSYARTRACLHRLVGHGLVAAEDAGSAVLYRLNREHVLAGPVVTAVQATSDVEAWLTERLRSLEPAAFAVVIFGSWARGEADPDSDLDLLVVRAGADEVWAAELHSLSVDLEALCGNHIQVLQISRDQLVQAVLEGQPLIAGLRADGRALVRPAIRELLGLVA